MSQETVVADMLSAAENKSVGVWDDIKDSLADAAKDAAQNSAGIAADLAEHKITEAEAETLFEAQEDLLRVAADELDAAAKLAAEESINAAIDVLWNAVKTGALL